MLFYHAAHNVVDGMHPLTQDDIVYLAGLHVHSLYGDYDPAHPIVNSQTLPNFVAPHFRSVDGLIEKINRAHSKLFSQSISSTKAKYLESVSKWHLSSASLFLVEQSRKSPKHVVLAINEDVIMLLAPPTMDVIARFAFAEILNWSVFPGSIRFNTGSAMKPVAHSFNTAQCEQISDMLNYWRSSPNISKSASRDNIRPHKESGQNHRSKTDTEGKRKTKTLTDRNRDSHDRKTKYGSLRRNTARGSEPTGNRERSASTASSTAAK
jgi:hypothetical protein